MVEAGEDSNVGEVEGEVVTAGVACDVMEGVLVLEPVAVVASLPETSSVPIIPVSP